MENGEDIDHTREFVVSKSPRLAARSVQQRLESRVWARELLLLARLTRVIGLRQSGLSKAMWSNPSKPLARRRSRCKFQSTHRPKKERPRGSYQPRAPRWALCSPKSPRDRRVLPEPLLSTHCGVIDPRGQSLVVVWGNAGSCVRLRNSLHCTFAHSVEWRSSRDTDTLRLITPEGLGRPWSLGFGGRKWHING